MSIFAFIAAAILLTRPIQCRPAAESAVTGQEMKRVKRDVVTADDLTLGGFQYYKKLNLELGCKHPQPRVIPVQHFHPSNEITYVTQCVSLHQCAYDTGCCPASEICAPTEKEDIQIPILIQKAGELLHGEMMTFVNHTACGCFNKADI